MHEICMSIPRLKSFLGFFSLETGAVALGILDIVVDFYIFSINLLLYLRLQDNPNYDGFPVFQSVPLPVVWSLILAVFVTLCHLLLLLGVFVNNPRFLLPALWFDAVIMCLGYVFCAIIPFFAKWEYAAMLSIHVGELFLNLMKKIKKKNLN